jgi:hypothetical protein
MLNDDLDRKRLLTLYFMTLPEHLAPEAFADLFAQDVETVLQQLYTSRTSIEQRPYVVAKVA